MNAEHGNPAEANSNDNNPDISWQISQFAAGSEKTVLPGRTFHRFTRSYLRTLSLLCDEMPEVKISDNEMVVNFSNMIRTYTLA